MRAEAFWEVLGALRGSVLPRRKEAHSVRGQWDYQRWKGQRKGIGFGNCGLTRVLSENSFSRSGRSEIQPQSSGSESGGEWGRRLGAEEAEISRPSASGCGTTLWQCHGLQPLVLSVTCDVIVKETVAAKAWSEIREPRGYTLKLLLSLCGRRQVRCFLKLRFLPLK